MLQLRPNCEYCDKDLPPHAVDARICSYECTFCAALRRGGVVQRLPELRWRVRPTANPPHDRAASWRVSRQAARFDTACPLEMRSHRTRGVHHDRARGRTRGCGNGSVKRPTMPTHRVMPTKVGIRAFPCVRQSAAAMRDPAALNDNSAKKDRPVSEPDSSRAYRGPPRSSTMPNNTGAPPCRIRAGADRKPVRRP